MEKNLKEARRRQEDLSLNRALMWVGGAIVLEGLLLFVNRYYINFFVSEVDLASIVLSVLEALRVAGAAAGLLVLAWAVVRLRAGRSAAVQAAAAVACLALAFCAYVTLVFHKAGLQMLFLLVPAWAGLALAYYLYQREFFLAAAASGMSGLALWFVRVGGRREAFAFLALVGLLLAALFWLKRNGGRINLGNGRAVRVLEADAAYGLVLGSCIGGMAAVIAGLLLGSMFAYYLIFAAFAWLFVLLVYYTVKMM